MSEKLKNITASVLALNDLIGIRDVQKLNEVATVAYSYNTRMDLVSILKKGEYEKLNYLEPPKDFFGEELTIVHFEDEKERQYYALYFSSFDINKRSDVLEVIPVK
jgi:hypothetical protein